MSLTLSRPASSCSRDDLHAYQQRAIEFIKVNPSCALWVEMGLGKTISVLTAIADLLAQFDINRTLIIAPLRVAQTVWPAEINKWGHTRHLTYRLLCGSQKQRQARLKEMADLHIINRENIPWLVEELRGDWPYDMVIIDEASSFKSPQSKRFKALRKVLPLINRLIELTGTPASNGLLDLWSQAYLLDRGKRLEKTFTRFKNLYFDSDSYGYSLSPKPSSQQHIYDSLSDICLTLSARDYLDLPSRISNIVPVLLPEKASLQYKQLEHEFLLQLSEDKSVAVLHAAALSNKLLQFANGAIYTDEQKNWEEIHDAKLDALLEIIEEAVGQPILVAYNYRTDATRLMKRFPQADIVGNDPNIIKKWNAGEIPLLLAHPASAGHGLNLQAGGHIIVWFGLNWSLELYEQFNARLHRQGQKKPVIIHHIVAQNTIDESVLTALQRKHCTQQGLLDALKENIKQRAGVGREEAL